MAGTGGNRWEPVDPKSPLWTVYMSHPHVLVSSRDGAPVPDVAGARRLAELARAHGWTATSTYALADVPERVYLNGELATAAHHLATVAVRLVRGDVRGWATWGNAEGDGWRFVAAWVSLVPHGWSTRAGVRVRSILERVTDEPIES